MPRETLSKRIVIAGFGDTGLLVAADLGRSFDVVGVSSKPCLLSGQDLGVRLTRPEAWKSYFVMPFGRYRALDGVEIVHGSVRSVDPGAQTVRIAHVDGRVSDESYDVLVLSPGVTNGFWRNAEVQDLESIEQGIQSASAAVAAARTIAVVGGGATGVGSATNFAECHPGQAVHLFFSQDRPLPAYHPRVRASVERYLRNAGVELHPGHRAAVPDGFTFDTFTADPLHFTTGQPAFEADLTLWAVGRARPNTGFVPLEMLDEHGFIRTDRQLRVPGYANVFSVGDAAATDPNRCSARNGGYRVVAHNVRALFAGRDASMKTFAGPGHRWGSILGVQADGLRVFNADGSSYRMPRWFVDRVLFPVVVRKAIYRGIRRPAPD